MRPRRREASPSRLSAASHGACLAAQTPAARHEPPRYFATLMTSGSM